MQEDNNDFSGLTPEIVLDALASIGLYSDGRLLALNSYENRVYQVGMEEGAPIIVKFYRPKRWTDAQILEEHTFTRELVAEEIPVVPALSVKEDQTLYHFNGYRFSVFERHGGRAPELDNAETLEWLGRFIGRIHAVGRAHTYQVRPALNKKTFGEDSMHFLLDHDFIPSDLVASYHSTAEQVLLGINRCEARAGELNLLRLHGDCHVGNVLWTDAGPHFVDFDDSRMGPAVQDLWMLLSGDRQDMVRQLADILAGYEDFCEFDPRELYVIESLRSLRLMHYAAWLAKRWDDPAFPAAFPWFNTQQFWQNHILALREQIALMDEPPLWPV